MCVKPPYHAWCPQLAWLNAADRTMMLQVYSQRANPRKCSSPEFAEDCCSPASIWGPTGKHDFRWRKPQLCGRPGASCGCAIPVRNTCQAHLAVNKTRCSWIFVSGSMKRSGVIRKEDRQEWTFYLFRDCWTNLQCVFGFWLPLFESVCLRTMMFASNCGFYQLLS